MGSMGTLSHPGEEPKTRLYGKIIFCTPLKTNLSSVDLVKISEN